ncbi:hypothetical protein [Rosistilla oblonga]|uniref:hypothetical protein n=1 Tax=Rosistilla oblonga TaxID=2527990 RepID=UPI003A96AA72
MFNQHEDGSHEITLHGILCPGCDVYPRTSGVLRWRHDAGATFELNFAGINSLIGTRFCRQPHRESPGVGRFTETDLNNPDWVAETDDGTRVALYGVDQIPTSTQIRGTSDNSVSCSFKGMALFAVVDIPVTRLFAFENSTVEGYRMFFAGNTGHRHQRSQEVNFTDSGGTVTTTMRCSTLLAESPRTSLVAGDALVKCQPSGWLGFETAPVDQDCEIGASAEQSFVSFLNGEKVPFYWADRKQDGAVRRTYFGWVRAKLKDHEEPDHQPLPYLGGVEAFAFGDEVRSYLPAFFQKYVERYRDFDFTAALHPLWTALDRDSVLQDRLALASVSLERTLALWNKSKKANLAKSPESDGRIWNNKALRRSLRRILKDALIDFVKSESCDNLLDTEKLEFQRVVTANIEKCTAPPNSAKLKSPFLDLGIPLSPDDEEALGQRNTALHGRNCGASELAAIDKEAEYFDRLRMLITKFVLRLCDYSGPYIDYASRPTSGNFTVDRMKPGGTTDSEKTA